MNSEILQSIWYVQQLNKKLHSKCTVIGINHYPIIFTICEPLNKTEVTKLQFIYKWIKQKGRLSIKWQLRLLWSCKSNQEIRQTFRRLSINPSKLLLGRKKYVAQVECICYYNAQGCQSQQNMKAGLERPVQRSVIQTINTNLYTSNAIDKS